MTPPSHRAIRVPESERSIVRLPIVSVWVLIAACTAGKNSSEANSPMRTMTVSVPKVRPRNSSLTFSCRIV